MAHKFKKQFGQNFLRTSKFPTRVVESLNLQPGDFVVEIGPGDGALTKLILDKGIDVVCVEIDYDLITKLITKFGDYKNFKLINVDILQLNLDEIRDKYSNGREINVIGSLPYNISKKIIKKLLDWSSSQSDKSIRLMSFIVQDEVAKEYVSKAPRATYLSNYLNLYSKAKKLESIPASQFFPKPKVDGGILLIEPKVNSEIPKEHKNILKFIKIGYSSPRKKLRNNLNNINEYKLDIIDKAFQKLEININTRAAELPSDKWVDLYNELKTA